MPSIGLEFISQMGVYLPDYVEAALEIHTNLYHESSINVKVGIHRGQMKLSIPVPASDIQLLSVRSVIKKKNISQSRSWKNFITAVLCFSTQQQSVVGLLWSNNHCTIVGGEKH